MQQSELNSRISAYLQDIAARLSSRPEDERSDLLRNIEDHIHEALRQRSGAHPTQEDLNAVLSGMDAPDSYGPPVLANATVNAGAAMAMPLSTGAAQDTSWHLYLWSLPAMIGFAVFWFASIFIMPKFEMMYRDLDIEQPALTKWVLSAMAFSSSHYVLLIVGLLTVAVARKVHSNAEGPRVHMLTVAVGSIVLAVLSMMLGEPPSALLGFACLFCAIITGLTLLAQWLRYDPRKLSLLNTCVASITIVALTVSAVAVILPLIRMMEHIGK